MKKGQVQPLVALMIALIVGIAVAVPVVIDMVTQATSSASVSNEAITCTNSTTQTLTYDNLLAGTFAMANGSTGTVYVFGSANYTLSTSAGTVNIINISNSVYGSSCVANYTYYPDAYQTSSTNRTLTGILPLLLVVALVLIVVGWMKLK